MTAENRVGALAMVLAAATSLALAACSSAPASPSTTTPNPRADDVPVAPAGPAPPPPPPSPPSSPATETKSELPLQTEPARPIAETPPPDLKPITRPALGPVFGCPRAAVLVVLDRSGSMSGRPIEMAVESSQHVANALTEKDCFGVIVFDSITTRLVSIAKMNERHREETTAGLKKLTAGGGTDIHPALSLALEDIRAVTSTNKKLVIFLTDGQSPQNGLKDLATTMGHENIFLTTIALGAGADKDLLRDLASAANGRFYSVMNVDQLPKVFEKEAQIITNANVKK